MVMYENFEDWFDELENYNFRSDRFFQHLELITNDAERIKFIRNWMRAAFDSGRLEQAKLL